MTPMSRERGERDVGKGTNAGETRGCALALALLSTPVMGCVNPLFFDNVAPAANHAPVVINMQPQPTFGRIVTLTGLNCAPNETFIAARVEDADFDRLTASYTLLLPRDETPDGARVNLLEIVLEPLPEPVDGVFYVLPPFQLDATTLRTKIGVAELNVQAERPEGQLLELRISDGGFVGADDVAVPDGAGLFFMSWAIQLTDPDVACEGAE